MPTHSFLPGESHGRKSPQGRNRVRDDLANKQWQQLCKTGNMICCISGVRRQEMKQKCRKDWLSQSNRRTKIGSRQEEVSFKKQEPQGHLNKSSGERKHRILSSVSVWLWRAALVHWSGLGQGNETKQSYSETEDWQQVCVCTGHTVELNSSFLNLSRLEACLILNCGQSWACGQGSSD